VIFSREAAFSDRRREAFTEAERRAEFGRDRWPRPADGLLPGAGRSVLAAPLPGIPFCVALALHREARNPESYDETALRDPQIRALCRRVRLVPKASGAHGWMESTVTITLTDGRRIAGHAENGMIEPGELDDKSVRLTRQALGEPGAMALFERLQRLEDEENLNWLGAQPKRDAS
jgi:hypothetical protein